MSTTPEPDEADVEARQLFDMVDQELAGLSDKQIGQRLRELLDAVECERRADAR